MEEIKELIREQRRQGEKVDAMHKVIAGQPEYGQPGMKDTFITFDKRITSVEEKQEKEKKMRWKIGILSGSVGGALGVLAPKAILAKLWAIFGF
jgi:hypothetical protein